MATREEIYAAIKNADAANDSESVQKLSDYLKTMPAEGKPAVAAAPKPEPKSELQKAGHDLGAGIEGVGELGLTGLTGAVGTVSGGLAGIGQTANRLLRGDSLDDSLAKGGATTRAVRDKLTYEPKSDDGKELAHTVSLPMKVASELLGEGGEKAGSLVGPKTAAAGRTIGEVIPEGAAAALGARALKTPLKEAAPVAGKDYSPLRNMSKPEADRFYSMKDQGVDPTLGNVTRDPAQVRFEQQTAQTEAGARLDQRHREQDTALLGSIEKLKKGETGKNEADTGRSVRGALESKAAAKKQDINQKYDKARAAGETKEMIDTTSLGEYFKRTEADAIAVPELNAMKTAFETLQKKNEHGQISIDDLELLREKAGKLQQRDGSVKTYMGEIRDGIDKMTEGKGGDLYKAARKSRFDYGTEFEEHRGVGNIVDKSTRTDLLTAAEDVFNKTVIGGSIDELGQVVSSLRTAGKEQMPAATQALKDLQTRTIDHLSEAATRNSKGDRINFSPAGMKKAMTDIGDERLNLLLGKEAVNELKKTLRNAEDVKTNPVRAPGSDTSLNQRTMVEKLATEHAEHVLKGVLPSWAGRIMDSVRARAQERAGKLKMDQAVDESLTPRRASLSDVAAEADKTRKERSKYVMKEAATRYAKNLPATTQAQDQ
jgi:hypothetical protein